MYPKFKNKHLEEAFFNPKDYTDWRKSARLKNKKLPKKYIFIYYEKILNHFRRKYHPKKIKLYRLLTIYKYKNIGVVRMTGIGSPHVAAIMEEVIALGGKEFLNIGSAGGLDSFGIFLCQKAIRDEGTSYHYIPHGDFSYPDKILTKKLEKSLKKNKIEFKKGITWTIDAPYRETKAEIKKYRKEGVNTVEMESAALFAVAKLRKVKIGAAFVVSDLFSEHKWEPQFDKKHVNKKLNLVFDAALACLLKK